jgi:hypothetical protein
MLKFLNTIISFEPYCMSNSTRDNVNAVLPKVSKHLNYDNMIWTSRASEFPYVSQHESSGVLFRYMLNHTECTLEDTDSMDVSYIWTVLNKRSKWFS